MTFAELKQEVIDRGYDYIAPTRIASFVQRSYRALCSRYAWPFLETNAEGTAPLELADLRHILSVTDASSEAPLYGRDRRWLLAKSFNLAATGSPGYWYLDGPVLKTYPVSGDTLAVRYLRRPAQLADGDEPLVPEEWQYLIVDGAIVHCLRDDDEYAEARALKQDNDQALGEMVNDLMKRDYQSNRVIVKTGGVWDYLG